MKKTQGPRIGIVNPLTLVGNELSSILRERRFPSSRISLLDTTGTSSGALTEIAGEPVVVTALTDDELDTFDLLFFCGTAEQNHEWIEKTRGLQLVAVDLSQPAATEDGRLTIAGLNEETLDGGDDLLVSPHPITIPLALILNQLATLGAVELCAASVIQPASEFDQAGIEELAKQTVSVLNVKSVPQTVFNRQAAFNLYPATERREAFIATQLRTILGAVPNAAKTRVTLSISQGTIFHSHTFSVFVQLAADVTEAQVLAAFGGSSTFALAEGDQEFGTIDAAGKDEVLIAEVRRDEAIEGGFWIWAVCDNLRRSSALNAVLIAEKAMFGLTPAN